MKNFDDLAEKAAKLADQGVKVASEGLEQAKTVAGDAIEQAKAFAGEIYDKAQKKAMQLSLENDLRKSQRQLGALYYLMRKTGEDNEELLNRYYEEVAEIEAKLEKLREEPRVPVDDIATEEPEAEAEEPKAEEEPEEREKAPEGTVGEEVICPVCGATCAVTDVYCPVCGTKLKEE